MNIHKICFYGEIWRIIPKLWAMSWENLFMPYANNKGADQPAHPRSLISIFVVRCLDSIIPILAIAQISRLEHVSVAEQIVLSLTWTQSPKTGFLVTWLLSSNGPRQANLVQIAYASSEGSGEPAHPRSLARTFTARSYKQWVKRNLQTESQIPGPSEWLGLRS